MDRRWAIIHSVIRNTTQMLLIGIAEEIDEERNETKRVWTTRWMSRGDSLEASTSLLKELKIDDLKEYFVTLRVSENIFYLLLNRTKVHIQQRDTCMR